MSRSLVEKVANAVLYEGYMLYPYSASSVKNRHRFNWGTLVPRSYSQAHNGTEASEMQTEVLVRSNGNAIIEGKVRFLHLISREIWKVSDNGFEPVASMEVDGKLYRSWDEATEREVDLIRFEPAADAPCSIIFGFPDHVETEQISDAGGNSAGKIIRKQAAIKGGIEVINREVRPGIFKLTVRVKNLTHIDASYGETRENILLRSPVSTHTILNVTGGEFISLIDPPDDLLEASAECENIGTYPVLAGEGERSDCILSSPIILYDHPQIAPESPGDLFDSTEIDEILTLRIMTLTKEEKREMRSVDDRVRAILERTEMMSEEQLIKMHGALRGLNKSRTTHG